MLQILKDVQQILKDVQQPGCFDEKFSVRKRKPHQEMLEQISEEHLCGCVASIDHRFIA